MFRNACSKACREAILVGTVNVIHIIRFSYLCEGGQTPKEVLQKILRKNSIQF